MCAHSRPPDGGIVVQIKDLKASMLLDRETLEGLVELPPKEQLTTLRILSATGEFDRQPSSRH
jgi:hypothetical protein